MKKKNKYKSRTNEKKIKDFKETAKLIDFFMQKKSKNHLFLFLNLYKYLSP